MDRKKLIGTIIGVVAFAALIAGATYAWLSVNASITNGNYAATSKDFVINYAGDSNGVGGVNQIANTEATTANITSASLANVAGDGWVAVTASKSNNSPKASSFKIKLSISQNTLETDSLLYAVCNGACPTGVALATVDNGTKTCGTGVTECGIIPGGSEAEVTLLNDTTTFNTLSSASATYNVYFWLNSNTISNDDMGANFTGYIHADATQGE